MKINQIYLVVLFLFFVLKANAQVTNTGLMDSTGGERINNISIGGYIDTYYGYHLSKPKDGNIPYFVTMNRDNELNINLAYLELRYQSDQVRAKFIPAVGTYMNSNYAAEPGLLKNILEASVGFRLSSQKNIWIEAGVLGSPYTNESAISRDHLMYTRSYAPEYVPYYLTGVKASIPLSPKVNTYLYLLNGWQQIQDQNRGKALGTQLEYRPNDKNLINWNTYLGDERSNAAPQNRMRYFTDLFWIYNPVGKVSITSSAYIGQQKRINDQGNEITVTWWQFNFISRYRFSEKASLSGRIEYFSDPRSAQIVPITPVTGFSSYSTGMCFNYQIADNLMFRMEGRHFFSDQEVYLDQNDQPAHQSTWLISNLTVWF